MVEKKAVGGGTSAVGTLGSGHGGRRVAGALEAERTHPPVSKEPERCKFYRRSEITPRWKSQSAAKPWQPHMGTS